MKDRITIILILGLLIFGDPFSWARLSLDSELKLVLRDAIQYEPRVVRAVYVSRHAVNVPAPPEELLPDPLPDPVVRSPNAPPEPPVESAIFKDPECDYAYCVLTKSRDQISSWNSYRKNHKKREVFALDFNWSRKKQSKALIVIRNNPSKELVKGAQEFVREMAATYKIPLHPGGRYGEGVRTRSENGRGIHYISHVEGFDGRHQKVVNRIRENPKEFANILAKTLGRIPGATFIAPHEKNSPGADTYDGISERTFALKYTIPALIELKD